MSKQSKAERKIKKAAERQAEQLENKLNTTPIKEGNIHFRFDYFDATHTHFDGSKADFDWARGMLARLKHFQNTTIDTFKTDLRYKKSQYIHEVKWDEANLDSFGIQNASPDLDEDAWQFGISKANGRIHGFFIGDFFYIVWIDPEHRLADSWTPN